MNISNKIIRSIGVARFLYNQYIQKGQFYVRSGDFDRFLRGQSDMARIIRVAQCEEIGWHGESHTWIECDNMGEVGTFYEVKEEGGLDG